MSGACHKFCCIVWAVLFGWTGIVSANVFNMPAGQTSLQFVSVGNAGNAPNPVIMSDGTSGYGSVGYNYKIGKFEVTIGQYTQFLNAVAATDTYALYNTNMTTDGNIAGISRSGASGSYSYNTIGSPNRPMAYVSWADSARFANWLTNGQPTGPQGPGTTETGSYALNGATTSAALNAVTRDPNARYVIPSENEWFKAAHHDPGRVGNYWLYAMRTDAVPYSDQPPGTTSPNPAFAANYSNYDGTSTNGYNDGFAVTGTPGFSFSSNYLTDVGAYTSALSYYGTFDQAGNVSEWDESLQSGTFRGLTGGSWGDSEYGLQATTRGSAFGPLGESEYFGFRIVEVPEPATALLLLAALPLLRRRRERIAL